MENPIKMDDLGVPLFLETSIYIYTYIYIYVYIYGSFRFQTACFNDRSGLKDSNPAVTF